MDEENSAMLKLLRDPTSVKLFCAGLSFLQLLLFGMLDFNSSPILTIVISSITFLSSLLVISLVVNKKTEAFAKFRFWKCITGKVEIEWDGMYYTYVTVFSSFNLLAIVDNFIHLGKNHEITMGLIVIAILGMVLTFFYFVEAYRSYVQIKANFGDMANEVYAPTCYARFLKLIGRFPVIMRLVILVLSVVSFAFIDIGRSMLGWYCNYDCRNFFTIFALFAASLLIGISVINIGFIKFKCFLTKLEKVTNKDIACCIRSGLPLAMASISFCSFGVSLPQFDRDFITPIIAGITLVATLLLALAESHGKMEDGGSQFFKEDQRSMLPKNLSKHIMNPIVSDQLKNQFVADEANH